MSNYIFCEIRGEVELRPEVTHEQVSSVLADAEGHWSLEDGALWYLFEMEGYFTPEGSEYGARLDRLVELGYNLAAWREEYQGSSETTGGFTGSTLRGTPEQKRQLRLREIDAEIAALEREQAELLATLPDSASG